MSERKLLDNSLLAAQPLVSTEDFLTKFAECSLFTFSAKTVESGKIFIHNDLCADLYGLRETGLSGMTSRDCLEQIKPFQQKESALNRWKKEDEKALAYNTAQRNVITILDHTGMVRVREHLTIPVCGTNKQIVALAAFCYDRTCQIDFFSLFERYKKFYPKSQATVQFSKYLAVDSFFRLALTQSELYTLLALTQTSRHKRAAYLLSLVRQKAIAPTTVSGHVEHIKDKLKPSIELEKVIIYLRSLYQWTTNQDTF